MQKYIFFWIIVTQFVISFIVTIFGIIGWVTISSGVLTTLVSVLIVEQAACIYTLFKSTEFFGSSSDLNSEGWDLLATLWKFQKQCFPNEPKQRWGFSSGNATPEFSDLAIGYHSAFRLGYTYVGSSNLICLTDKGFQFCQQNEKQLAKCKRYFFIA